VEKMLEFYSAVLRAPSPYHTEVYKFKEIKNDWFFHRFAKFFPQICIVRLSKNDKCGL